MGSALLWFGAIPLIVAIALQSAGNMLTVLRVAENWVQDLRVAALSPPLSQFDDLIVITIDTDSLAQVPYISPLDRGLLRDVLVGLAAKGVRAVGLDVLFTRPTEPAKDAALREVLLTYARPLVVATAGTEAGLQTEQVDYMHDYLEGVTTAPAVAYQDREDGVVRSVLLRRHGSRIEQLGFAARLARLLGATVPRGEELVVAFRSRSDPPVPAFVQFPAHFVPTLPREFFADKIALVGADLPFTDRHRTPLSNNPTATDPYMPGVMIHAHTLAQLMEGRSLHEIEDDEYFLILLLAAATGVVLIAASASPVYIVIASASLILMGWVAGFVAFYLGGPLVPLVVPTLAFVIAFTLTFGARWKRELTDRRFIQRAFAKFVSPAVVKQLVENPEMLKVGGEKRDVTFLFTDIANYTALSERTDAATLVQMMNDYFEGALRIVLAHDGTVDRLQGDSLVVIFNAPSNQPDHAARGVRCALELDGYFRAFVDRQKQNGVEFGLTRIGVNSGSAVVGNYGGQAHFEYTATGDTTIIASRLESANRYLGTRICISGVAFQELLKMPHQKSLFHVHIPLGF